MPSQHAQDLVRAFVRYDHYMHYEHVAQFEFTHHEFFQRFVEKANKKGILTRSITEQWVEDLGICEVVEVAGHFRGTMIDNLTDGIKQNLALGGMLYDNCWCDHDLLKTTKIDCIRKDRAPRIPSVLSSKELAETWLNPGWTP